MEQLKKLLKDFNFGKIEEQFVRKILFFKYVNLCYSHQASMVVNYVTDILMVF